MFDEHEFLLRAMRDVRKVVSKFNSRLFRLTIAVALDAHFKYDLSCAVQFRDRADWARSLAKSMYRLWRHAQRSMSRLVSPRCDSLKRLKLATADSDFWGYRRQSAIQTQSWLSFGHCRVSI